MKIRTAVATTSATALLVLSGCGSTEGGTVSDDSPEGSNAQAESNEGEASEDEPAEQGDPTFGQTYTTSNGLAITISEPTEFEPSEFAFVEGEGQASRFDVTVVNNTGETWEPDSFYVTAQSGDTEAAEIYDADSIGDRPTTGLRDGRQVRFALGFMLADPADVVMDVDPEVSDFDSEQFTYISQ